MAQSNYDKVFEEIYRKMDTMLDSKTAVEELKVLYKNGKSAKEDHVTLAGFAVNHAETSGCTACCAIITQDKIFVGNLGDSRAVLAKTQGSDSDLRKDQLEAVDMSIDMKPDLECERKRIIAAGGEVLMGRVDGGLSLSAAIGDKQYKRRHDLPPEMQKVTIVPQVHIQNLNKDCKFLILACDGIWDCKSSQQTVDFFTKKLWSEHKHPFTKLCSKEDVA